MADSLAVTNLGRVAIQPKGQYDAATAYKQLDVVQFERNGYIARKDTQGNPPTDAASWMQLTEVERGAAAYVWIRYADQQPTSDADMKDTPGDWLGIYSGTDATAPTTYTAYTWQLIVAGGTGAGDMRKSEYDKDSSGQVDKADDADKLGGKLPAAYAEAAHTHADYLEKEGDASNVTAAFTQSAAAPANIASGESLKTIFGKVRKWFATFGDGAWASFGGGNGDLARGNHAHDAGQVTVEQEEWGNVQAALDDLAARDVGSLAVLVTDTLPEEATKRTIAIITDTPSDDIIIAMEAPEGAEGRIWVKNMPVEPYMITENGEGIVSPAAASQYLGGYWEPVEAHFAVYGGWVQFSRGYTVLGYQWAYTNSSPLLTRIEDAASLTATASIGTAAGASDFDIMPIYRDIRRCNLAADGTINAYEGDAGYTTDGSNGDVMVEIPKFWFRVEVDTAAQTRRFMICDKEADGFAVYPLFLRADGSERDKAYVGAYETGAAYTSKAGVAPLVNQTRAVTRAGAAGKGSGWSIQNLPARLAITELIRIEFATHNAQAAIGQGNSSTTAAIATGRTDSIAGHTGREAGTDTAVSVVWRGIENFWGNVWEWADGFNFNNGTFYYCLDATKYADDTASNYTALSFTVATNLSASYGSALGYDANSPWVALPSAFSGGSATAYLCDGCWSSTGWRVARAGGAWASEGADGPSCWSWVGASSYAGASVGSRLQYAP
ncbi:hypothetical protein LJC74_06935 [Eubacteriales bacterium OttesenSCG-928-A19]|nr:hypothetical protein [Eubacteriales bacterium OttesenSCG-928-A19]